MNKLQIKHITGAWRYYFVTICSGILIFTWSYRGFQTSGSEDAVVGYFVLYGVIASLSVYSMRRSIYRKISETDSKAYKKLLASKGKQRPLEISKGKGNVYSQSVEDLLQTYNIFRLANVVFILVYLILDVLLLM